MKIWNRTKEAMAPQKTWPDCEPIDKSDPHWKFNNNFTCNGTPYKKEEVEPGRWQWVVDEESLKVQQDAERHRTELWRALRTRVLSDEEMAEVRRYGDYLNVPSNTPYNGSENAAS